MPSSNSSPPGRHGVPQSPRPQSPDSGQRPPRRHLRIHAPLSPPAAARSAHLADDGREPGAETSPHRISGAHRRRPCPSRSEPSLARLLETRPGRRKRAELDESDAQLQRPQNEVEDGQRDAASRRRPKSMPTTRHAPADEYHAANKARTGSSAEGGPSHRTSIKRQNTSARPQSDTRRPRKTIDTPIDRPAKVFEVVKVVGLARHFDNRLGFGTRRAMARRFRSFWLHPCRYAVSAT